MALRRSSSSARRNCNRLSISRSKKAVRAAAVAFGEIERHVGVLQQQIGVGAVVRRDGDADTGADDDVAALDVIGPADQFDDARGELAALLRPTDIGLNDREFVAADAGDEIRGWHRLGQADGHELQSSSPIGWPSVSFTVLK